MLFQVPLFVCKLQTVNINRKLCMIALIDGLVDVCQTRPEDPIDYLVRFFYDPNLVIKLFLRFHVVSVRLSTCSRLVLEIQLSNEKANRRTHTVH